MTSTGPTTEERVSRRFALWSAGLTALSAAAALGLGLTTPPRSGPFCAADCIEYPYTDAAAFVPSDYAWMYPALAVALSFVMLVACITQFAPAGRRHLAVLALAFAILAAGFLVMDYVVQLAVVQPSLLKGEASELTLLSQYNPHGVFVALEDGGYLVMGLAFLSLAPTFVGSSRLSRAARYVFLLGGLVAVAALPIFIALFGADLEYRYEVAAISVDWLTLIVGGAVLTQLFRRPT